MDPRTVTRSPPRSVVEFASIGVLLSLLTVAETVLSDALRELLERSAYYVTSHLYGTIVFGAIGLTVLGIGFFVHRRIVTRPDQLDEARPIQPLLALALLVVGGSYAVSNLTTPSASLFQSFAVSVVGMGGLSVAYARVRETELRITISESPARRTIVIAGLGPALLVGLSFLGWEWVGSPQSVFGRPYLGTVSILDIGQYAVVTSVFAAFGAGLLFHGVIQERIRECTTSTGAIAGITVLVSLHRWMTPRLIALDRVVLLLAILPTIALIVLGSALVVRLGQTLDRTVRDDRSTDAAAAVVGLLVMALVLGVWHGLLGISSAWLGGYTLVYSATIGIASVTYERTRSVWTPMLAILSFYVSADVAPYLVLS